MDVVDELFDRDFQRVLIHMGEIAIGGYVPGAIGRITELHGTYYEKYWGFGLFFESKVATEMCDFLHRFDIEQDGFWVALINGKIVGGIAIDGVHADGKGAHLRWFIVDPDHHGTGIGSMLISRAVTFCKEKKYEQIYLWTFAGLDAARHLYETHGFRISRELKGDQWGVTVTEQMFELHF